ncbi:hypothetical protein AB6809_29360 [Paraburkholderia sp. RCC_158]|uniref:hypothetical protein n=1 Tax=Paraburkholderia sp. RCC_158 TaxID=3239220 RepID=UPI003524A01D
MSDTNSAAPKSRVGQGLGTKKLTESQKATMIALWESGEVTLSDLARRFARTERGVSLVLSKAGAEKGSKRAQVQSAVTEQVNAQLAGEAGVIAGKIRETKDSHYAAAKVIAGLIQKQLVTAQQQGHPFATVQNEIKTLKLAAEALATLREERFILLGINDGEKGDEDELPELGIHEMTADQILEMQQRQDDSGIDMGDDDIMTVLPSPDTIDMDEGGDAAA